MIQEGVSRHFEYDAGDVLRAFYEDGGAGTEPSTFTHYPLSAESSADDGMTLRFFSPLAGSPETQTPSQSPQKSLTCPNTKKTTMPIRIANFRIGTPFSGDNAPAVRYYLEDHPSAPLRTGLGNCSFSLESNGSLFSREDFPTSAQAAKKALENETSFGSFAKKRYRFCGKERDEESGLYYYGARYYAAWTCRFVSVDPLAGEYPFYTPYSGMANIPVVFIDLDGNEPIPSTDVKQNEDGSYTIVNTQNDVDCNIYIVNDEGNRTGEIIGRTITPFDFMSTNDATGKFIFGPQIKKKFSSFGFTFKLNELIVNAHFEGVAKKYNKENLDAHGLVEHAKTIFKDNSNIEGIEPFEPGFILLELTANDKILDLKSCIGHHMYTPVKVLDYSNGTVLITSLRALGNIAFGNNLDEPRPFYLGQEYYYDSIMPLVGIYNQI